MLQFSPFPLCIYLDVTIQRHLSFSHFHWTLWPLLSIFPFILHFIPEQEKYFTILGILLYLFLVHRFFFEQFIKRQFIKFTICKLHNIYIVHRQIWPLSCFNSSQRKTFIITAYFPLINFPPLYLPFAIFITLL